MAVIDLRTGNEGLKYEALARFLSDMSARQSAEQANKQKMQMLDDERRRSEAQDLVKMLIENGAYGQADQFSNEQGLMLPPGGFSGVGEGLAAKAEAAAAAKAEQERLKQEQATRELMGLTNPTSPMAYNTMTDQSSGGGIVPPRTNVWEEETGLDPAQAEVLAAIKYSMTPEQLQSFRNMSVAPQERVRGIKMGLGLEQTADQATTSKIAQQNANTNSGELGLRTKEFEYRKTQDSKKAQADILKEAASTGLPPEEYKNLSGLLDDVRTAVKPQVDAIAAGEAIKQAIRTGDAVASQAGMIVFMKALDDSVAREGEVAALAASMGTAAQMRQKFKAAATGKSDPQYAATIEKLIDMVNAKNRALVDERLTGFDIQAEAAGPGAKRFYDRYRGTIKGGIGNYTNEEVTPDK